MRVSVAALELSADHRPPGRNARSHVSIQFLPCHTIQPGEVEDLSCQQALVCNLKGNMLLQLKDKNGLRLTPVWPSLAGY